MSTQTPIINQSLKKLRAQIREGSFAAETSGLMPEFLQCNVIVIEKNIGQEFIKFCKLNEKFCPLISVSEAGKPFLPELGNDLDIRIDLPEYNIFKNGEFLSAVSDIRKYWQKDFLTITLGCSYSFESALISAGYSIRNIEENLNVSMYNTDISVRESGRFSGSGVVSMRPFKSKDINTVVKITSKYTKAHGSPIHIGDPKVIGIENINQPDYGDPVTILEDEMPVFWACGVTSQAILKGANVPFFITHAPGKMLITDIKYKNII